MPSHCRQRKNRPTGSSRDCAGQLLDFRKANKQSSLGQHADGGFTLHEYGTSCHSRVTTSSSVHLLAHHCRLHVKGIQVDNHVDDGMMDDKRTLEPLLGHRQVAPFFRSSISTLLSR